MADRQVKVTLLAQVSNYLAGIEQAKNATSSMSDDAKKKLAAQKAALDATGKSMLALGTAAAVGVAASIKAFADYDAKMAQVQSLSHAGASDMDALRAATTQFATQFGISASQAADAEIELVKGGVSVKDMVNGGLSGALTLAAAGQIDVGDATSIAVSAMTQFGLSGKDVSHVADLLAAGADKALGSVSDLGEGLKYVGPVAASMGVSIDSTVGVLSELAQNGILAEQAGTGVRGMLQSLVSPSQQASQVMQKYNINLFDANGKFIGLAGAAQQLQDGFKGVTESERDYALGQIFGNQQVTVATVLMNGGAAAVNKWTKAVNDQGFAAQQAQGKLNSLNGDLTKLKAAFENDLIASGSAANGVLRALAQDAGAVVTAFGEAPKPVQEATLALGSITGAVGLFGGGLVVALPKIAEFSSTLGTLAEGTGNIARAAGGLKTAMSATAAFAFGPWGLAIGAAATVLGGSFLKSQIDAKKRVDDLTDTLDAQTGAITSNTRATVSKSLEDSGALTAAKQLGIALSTVTDAALGNKDAIAKVNKVVHDYQDEQAGALAATKGNRQEAKQYTADWQTLTNAIGEQSTAMEGARARSKDLTKAQADTATSSTAVAQGVQSVADAATEASDDLDDLSKSIADFGKTQLDVSSADIAFHQAIDDLTDSLKTNGKTLNENTQKGRDNQSALDKIASSAIALVAAHAAAGESMDQLTGEMQTGRQAFIDAAQAAGETAQQANDLADKYKLIPAQVSTLIQVTGNDTAEERVASFKDMLASIPGSTLTTVGVRLPSKLPDAFQNHANGGTVRGPGGPKSDSVLARLSAGEEVIQNPYAGMYREVLKQINEGTYPRGYANGGTVPPSAVMMAAQTAGQSRQTPVFVPMSRPQIIIQQAPAAPAADRPITMDGQLFGMLREMANGQAQIVVNSALQTESRRASNGWRKS